MNDHLDQKWVPRSLSSRVRGRMGLLETSSVLRSIMGHDLDKVANVGALPRELRERVADGDLSRATFQFHKIICNWIKKYNGILLGGGADYIYELREMEQLFNSPCIFECRYNQDKECCWEGAFGWVVKVSFPELSDAVYALKVFKFSHNLYTDAHGPWYEVPAAMRATSVQPRDIFPCYLAGLGVRCSYMLTKWGGDVWDGTMYMPVKHNPVFVPSDKEANPYNVRQWRMIDCGEFKTTIYGQMSWAAQKIYRKIANAGTNSDLWAVRKIIAANNRNYIKRQELRSAIEAALDLMDYSYKNPAFQELERYLYSHNR